MEKKHLKDPGSAITHGIAMIFAVLAAAPLILKSYLDGSDKITTISLAIFIVSMILLYSASTIYHSLDISEKINKRLRKLDHAMIFVLIAGSYTPVCVIAIGGTKGIILLSSVWAVAILGIIFKMCWITCPTCISSVMYIGMGWLCLFAFPSIIKNLSTAAFMWLLIGGIIYTVGGVIYALKLPIFNRKHKNFGSHEIFHLFIMGGSLCHFVLAYAYLA